MTDHARAILVGVDGSRAAHAAVRWSAAQARDLGRELVLLHAREDGRPIVLGRPRRRLSSWPGPTSLTRRVLAGAQCPVVLVPERLADVR